MRLVPSSATNRQPRDLRHVRAASCCTRPRCRAAGSGDEAYRFVDWLAAAGQSWWQVLPLGPPDEHGSPYRAALGVRGLARPARRARRARSTAAEVERFVARAPYWIGDWAAFAGGERARRPGALRARVGRAARVRRASAASRCIGDLPIYVAPDGADHAGRPELFQRRRRRRRAARRLSATTGQLWGNPLYDWHAMRATGYRWWIERFRRTFELVDIDARRPLPRLRRLLGRAAERARPRATARWRRGPGRELFDAVAARARRAAADRRGPRRDHAGRRAAARRARAARDARAPVRLPGDRARPAPAENHRENGVVYTGTHDNDTARGWWELARADASTRRRDRARPGRAELALIELALASRARLAIVPVQDLLGLGSEARMNTPGPRATATGVAARGGAADDALAARLRASTEAARAVENRAWRREPARRRSPSTTPRSTGSPASGPTSGRARRDPDVPRRRRRRVARDPRNHPHVRAPRHAARRLDVLRTHATVTGLATSSSSAATRSTSSRGSRTSPRASLTWTSTGFRTSAGSCIAEAWSPGPMPTLTRIRYGARGAGLEGYEEFGVRRVSAEELREWALRFSAGNAMLWLTGPPPVDLRRPLVDGPRLPCPTLDHRDLPLPMLASGDDCTWGLSFLAPPTTVARRARDRDPPGAAPAPAPDTARHHVLDRAADRDARAPGRPQLRRRRRPSRVRGARPRARAGSSSPNGVRTAPRTRRSRSPRSGRGSYAGCSRRTSGHLHLAALVQRDVTAGQPVEQRSGLVIFVRDEAVHRHRAVHDHLAHGALLCLGSPKLACLSCRSQ